VILLDDESAKAWERNRYVLLPGALSTAEREELRRWSRQPRRALYITYNRGSEGNRRADYYALKRRAFPPECERRPDAPPSEEARIFNLGNPIR
jgi:hypothetical protein